MTYKLHNTLLKIIIVLEDVLKIYKLNVVVFIKDMEA